MRAFIDSTGYVKFWLHPNGTWLLDVRGDSLALVYGDSIYDLRGRHAGWWTGAVVRDHDGRLVVADLNAVQLKGNTPPRHSRPIPPTVGTNMPVRPTLGLRPLRSPNRLDWANSSLFINSLSVSA
jgi:hypothetical protein